MIRDICGSCWCDDCPERVTLPGPTEGGLLIGPDEECCPCEFEVGVEGCVMADRFNELERMAAEMSELIGTKDGEV